MDNHVSDLLLLSGSDIPFPEAQLIIHQPTIKEISYIGEENFFLGCELLKFSKSKLSKEDKDRLVNQSDFDIIMSIVLDKTNAESQSHAAMAEMVLALLFPIYHISFGRNCIKFTPENLLNSEEQSTQEFAITNNNFDIFRNILVSMFCLKGQVEQEYNPKGDLAQKIADKIRKGKRKAQELKGEKTKISIFSRYVSILSVGEQKDMNTLLNYTVYQLFDEFERFQLKINYDIYMQAKMAGAKDLKEVDSWFIDIHDDSNKNKK